jgi:adenylylsulfate kinase-like enzyme
MVENTEKPTLHKIVWFFGIPTAGKSWTADFLEKYHGWVQVDGD